MPSYKNRNIANLTRQTNSGSSHSGAMRDILLTMKCCEGILFTLELARLLIIFNYLKENLGLILDQGKLFDHKGTVVYRQYAIC